MMAVRSFAASCALILGSVIVAFGVFEAYCRIVVDDGMHYHLEMWKYAVALKKVAGDPAIGHQHVPGAQARLMGVDVQINAEGLREKSSRISIGKKKRILMLGDSVTFGWGVPQSETVAARLEQALTRTVDDPVSVINAGVGNYNTAMEVAWFERHGLKYEPDMVVLNIFINDAEPTPLYANTSWWDRQLYSRVILFGAVDTVARVALGGPDWKDYYQGLYSERAAGWHAMQTAVSRLADLCRAQNIPLIIANYPELRELAPYPFSDVSAKIEALAQANDLPYVSLLPAVQNQKAPKLWVTPPDPHPNSYAAGLMADYLAPILSDVLQSGASGIAGDVDNARGGSVLP